MIEPIMYLGIGFLAASLIGLVVIPLVHARATRLTSRRMEAATPVSMVEIQADKDQLRAEFAMSTRRLEISVDQLKTRTTGQLAELGKKTDAINRLKSDIGEKTAAVFALESRENSLREQIRTSEEELAVKTTIMHEAARALSDKEADLARLTADLNERAVVTDSQRVEIVALRTQVEALKSQIDRFETEIKDAQDRLYHERFDADAAAKDLEAERNKVESLANRVADLERELLVQTTEAEVLNRRVQDLETRLTEQGRVLAERDYESTQLRSSVENTRRIETDLRAEIAALERRHGGTSAALRSEKAVLEKELEHTREERTKLQRELAAIKRETESTWAAERVENALLRERINDIATEVARLTMVLEGPGSPIEAMLAGQPARVIVQMPSSRRPAARKHPARLPPQTKAISPIAFALCRPALRASPL
jgi:chromosome segregation ATPase